MRYEVKEVDWKMLHNSLEFDYKRPCAWAVWDNESDAYLGKVWYKTKRAAKYAASVFNGERV